MKNIFFFIAICCFYGLSAQNSTLHITVKNQKNEYKPFEKVWLTKIGDGKIINGVNNKGKTTFQVESGQSYYLNLNDAEQYKKISIPSGGTWEISQEVLFDPKQKKVVYQKEHEQVGDFKRIEQNVPSNYYPQKNESFIVIRLKGNRDPAKVSGTEVRLIHQKKMYVAKSDNQGHARFIVPNAEKTFMLGIGDIDNYDQITIPDIPGISMGVDVDYVLADLSESLNNDTIVQNLPAEAEPTSDRVLIKLLMVDFSENPLEGEPVFFNQEKSSKVFKGTTDREGKVSFLLPKHKQYVLNFKYENQIDFFDLTQTIGFKTIELYTRYRGSRAIEDFYKLTKRDKNGFITEFMKSEIKKIPIHADYLIKKSDGFVIKLSESRTRNTPTPTVKENQIYVGGDLFDKHIHSFNKTNGQHNWSVELADGGPSSMYVENGVLLVNTYSCSIYALNALTGDLLWSKWLAPALYVTPAVYQGAVITAYPDECLNGSFMDRLNNCVVISMDVETGKINWQQRINAQPIGSIVACDGSYYVSTRKGTLYKINATTGTVIWQKEVNAVALPTISKEHIYVACSDGETVTTKEFDVKNCAEKKVLYGKVSDITKEDLKSVFFEISHEHYRVVIYKEKIFQASGEALFCFNKSDGRLLWTQKSTEGYSGMPVPVSNMIAIGGKSEKLYCYDMNTGKLVRTYDMDMQLKNHVVFSDGMIIGAGEGQVQVRKDGSIRSGWHVWCGNGARNTTD